MEKHAKKVYNTKNIWTIFRNGLERNMKDRKSLTITTGAMVTAIFGVLMLLNRQSGTLFEEIFIFLYPIPMVAFSAMYGVKKGIPVCVSMSLISVLFGNFTSIFYAVTQAVIGLIFGGCLHNKVDMTKTLFVVMILSAVVNLLNTVVLGALFGIDLNQEVVQMQEMMNAVFEQSGTVVPENIMTLDTLKQIFIVSMILSGFLQGFVVYEISLLILRRLRFPVQKPKPVFEYKPPRWTGYAAFLAFMLTSQSLLIPFENGILQNAVLAIGVFGYMYLICFGFIGILKMLKTKFPKLGKFSVVICILLLFTLPMVEGMVGFLYIVMREN